MDGQPDGRAASSRRPEVPDDVGDRIRRRHRGILLRHRTTCTAAGAGAREAAFILVPPSPTISIGGQSSLCVHWLGPGTGHSCTAGFAVDPRGAETPSL